MNAIHPASNIRRRQTMPSRRYVSMLSVEISLSGWRFMLPSLAEPVPGMKKPWRIPAPRVYDDGPPCPDPRHDPKHPDDRRRPILVNDQIGRASCRERVCQYV